jgi:nucleotidyltransferase/DNA polymerase involved in DNA repair
MPKEMLLREMGSFGEDIWHMARGLDNREVNEDWITKSIGRQYTFERDTKNKRFIMAMIDDMIREIYRELKEQNFFFKNITLKVRYEDFDTHTKSKTIEEYTDSVKTLRMIAEEQLNPFLKDNRRIRLVGISVHTLSDKKIKPKRKDMSLLSI